MSDQEKEVVQEPELDSAEQKPAESSAQADTPEAAVENDANIADREADEASSDEIENLRSELEQEKQKTEESRDLALRTQAEMENLRKRTVRDVENAHKYALEKFVNELLPIIDSMELGMNAAETAENANDIKQGMELTLKMFSSALEKFGVKVVHPEGEKFNPELHEAVSMQEIEGKESGTVVSVMQKGYELNGRLVRPAMVMVAK